MLPNGWKKVKLGDIATISSGSTPLRSNKAYFDNGNMPWVKTMDLTNGKITKTDECITELAAKKCKPYPTGTVLVAMYGGFNQIGRTGLLTFPASINQALAALQFDKDICSEYVLFYLNANVDRWRSCAASSRKDPNITSHDVEKFKIVLPPLEEQKKIAATLSVWDSTIEKMEKLIDAKESLLTEYGKELFGRTEQKQNENWSTIALSDVLNEHGDKSTGKEEVFSVSVHKGLVNQIEHLGRSFAAKDTSNYNRVHYGDIVYTKSPTGDFPLGIVKQSLIKEDVIVSPLYGVFTPKTFELGAILDFYFSSPINANNYLHPVAQKGAKNTINITNKKFLSAKLRLPIDIKEQNKIAQFVQTTKKEMAVLQEILENYKKQKQGLMQKLLTGQWRVK